MYGNYDRVYLHCISNHVTDWACYISLNVSVTFLDVYFRRSSLPTALPCRICISIASLPRCKAATEIQPQLN